MLELDINCEVVNHPIDSKRYWAADWHVKMYMSSGRLPCQSKVRELEILHYRLVWQGWHKNRNKRTTSLLKKKHFENLPSQFSHPTNSATWKSCNGDFQATALKLVDSPSNDSTSRHLSLLFGGCKNRSWQGQGWIRIWTETQMERQAANELCSLF